MEADQLRLILLFAGMAMVVMIYLWDRYKRTRSRLKGLSLRQARRVQRQLADEEVPAGGSDVPSFSAVTTVSEPVAAPVQEDDFFQEEEQLPAVEAVEAVEQPDAGFEMKAEEARSDSGAEPDSFTAAPEDDYLHMDSALQQDMPQMLVQISLVKRNGDFSGADIEAAMSMANLQPGAMDIFHRFDSRYPDRVLFSIANMVNPGHFPVQDMSDFSTPGLLFFTQLPGVRDGMEIYTDMLYAAHELAGQLDGVLQDDSHSVLSKQSIQHTRDAIMEHRRKLRLAKLHS
jgi:cell division protein ZipA